MVDPQFGNSRFQPRGFMSFKSSLKRNGIERALLTSNLKPAALFLVRDTLSIFFCSCCSELSVIRRQVFHCFNVKSKQNNAIATRLFDLICKKSCRREIRNKYLLNNMSLGFPESYIKLLYYFGVCLRSANILFCSEAMSVGNRNLVNFPLENPTFASLFYCYIPVFVCQAG